MKRVLLWSFGFLGAGGVGLTIMAATREPTIARNTFVGEVNVGGLTKNAAAFRLRSWWDQKRREIPKLESRFVHAEALRRNYTAYGLSLDDSASLSAVPNERLWESIQRVAGIKGSPRQSFQPQFRFDATKIQWLSDAVEKSQKGVAPARVSLVDGRVVTAPEASRISLDSKRLEEALVESLLYGKAVLPTAEGPKKVSNEDLAKIKEVITTYSTRFPASQTSRNTNIQLASGKIDGTILMPGEVFSFNGTVGRRTQEAGYKLAGVYRNGRHDFDIGGGICQVASTLYNAALLANVKVVNRQCHSLPVPYVPLGRDATVSFGSADLKFQNPGPNPIAIARKYEKGKLTFYILGTKDPSISVKLESRALRSWSHGTKYVVDRSVPAGKTRVVDKGGSGHLAETYRVVYINNKPVKREFLGNSSYRGGPRIIAHNPSAPVTTSQGTTLPSSASGESQ